MLAQREHDAALPQRRDLKSTNELPVEIACVETDGGRMLTRAAGQDRGVHERGWRETKVAALWKLTGPTFETDPQPEPPRCFLDSEHVTKMVREIKRQRSETHERDDNAEKTGSKPLPDPPSESESRERQYSPDFTPITDFVHPVRYLYDVAGAVISSWATHWEQYTSWMAACWQGRVNTVIAELHDWQTRLGPREKETPDHAPRAIVATTLTFLENNQSRMNDPQYRREGDPLTKHILSRPGCLYYRRTTAIRLATAST